MDDGNGVNGIENTMKRPADGATRPSPLAMLVAVSKFCEANDIPRVTFWRWQKRSWVKTIRIAGRLYMTREELDCFMARAERGEFSSVPKLQIAALPDVGQAGPPGSVKHSTAKTQTLNGTR